MLRNFLSYIKLKPVFAVGFLLCCTSLLFGTWVAAIPSVKYRLGLNDAGLGLSLLFSPAGALTGVLLAPKLFNKIPVGKWMIGGYMTTSLIMTALINAQSQLMLWLCLYFLGLVSFLNGVSVNTTISTLEKQYGRQLMSTSHALYSLGGGISAGLAAILFGVNIESGWQIVIVTAIIWAILFINKNYLLAHNNTIHSDSGIRLPSATILGISFICMVIFMAEGSVADWSAIFLRETLHLPGKFASLGYGVFAVAMTIGRLNGDTQTTKRGSKQVVITGALLAAAGFILVALSVHFSMALIGFIMIGFGCSGIVPVLFRASATIPGVSAVEGFAMVTTGGLIGFLTGPSLIGLISESLNLRIAFVLIITMALLAAYAGWRNKFLNDTFASKQESGYDEQIY
jgi:MFS family permease